MTNEEKKLLLEINTLYNRLLQEPFGQVSGSYFEKPNGYTYLRNAKELEDRVLDLFKKFQPEYISKQDLDSFQQTYNEDVSRVKSYYQDSLKSNAAKKRNSEFIESISKANDRIHLDLITMFIEIERIKRS